MNYSSNINYTKQTVRVRLQMFEFCQELNVEVRGNCAGFSVLGAAIDNAYEAAGYPNVVKLFDGDDTLTVEDEEGREEEWFRDLVVSAEIVAIEDDVDGLKGLLGRA